MRASTLITGAAMAAGAFASPLKRAVEVSTEYDVAYVTVYATVTDGVTTTANVATTTYVETTAYVQASAPPSTFVTQAASSSVDSSNKAVAASAPAEAPPAPASSAPASSAPANYGNNGGNGDGGWTSYYASTWTVTSSAAPSPTPEPTTVSSVAAPPPAASSEAPAPAGKVSGYQDIVIAHHNVHRANHSACDLVWDDALASSAAKIAATCVYAHSMDVDGGGYGQNIAAGVPANNVSAVITELFYNGEVGYYTNLYGQADPDMTEFEKWGHFSQLVWKNTTKVGCATQYCSGGLANVGTNVSPHFTVCNYASPGNYGGEYADNVGASLNQATVNWNYGL